MLRMFLVGSLFACCVFGWSLSASAGAPRLLAVKFHADWCGACQKMNKTMHHLNNKLDGRSVLFVTLDATNKTRKRRAGHLAYALGLKKVWRRYNGRTGFILLIDRRTGRVRGKLTSSMSLKSMTRKILGLLSSRAG